MEFMWNEVERFLFFILLTLLVRKGTKERRKEKNTIMCKLGQVVIKIEVGFTISHSFYQSFFSANSRCRRSIGKRKYETMNKRKKWERESKKNKICDKKEGKIIDDFAHFFSFLWLLKVLRLFYSSIKFYHIPIFCVLFMIGRRKICCWHIKLEAF